MATFWLASQSLGKMPLVLGELNIEARELEIIGTTSFRSPAEIPPVRFVRHFLASSSKRLRKYFTKTKILLAFPAGKT